MKIGFDILGGDFAPNNCLEGAILASTELGEDAKLVLIGDSEYAKKYFADKKFNDSHFEYVHTKENIEMGEHPTKAFSQKPNSSIFLGFKLLKDGELDAFISAGNTGAMLVGSMFTVKTVPGVIRPCITSIMPKENGGFGILLDVGTNADCKPDVLYQFGILGSILAKEIYKINNPKVALLNIGEEPEKGNLVAQAAHSLMKDSKDFNFVGNVEGGDIFKDEADVVVCEGFVGNVVLKMAEAFYTVSKKLKVEHDYFDKFNYELYGGTPILGINSNVIICHGISSPLAFKNSLLLAKDLIKVKLTEKNTANISIMIRASITAVAGYLPENIVTNFDLEKMIDTTDEWITTRTGIKQRHIENDPKKATSDMGVEAVKLLCKKRGIHPEEIDLLICGTVTPDMVFPATANLICAKIGAKNAWGYDLSAACSGFIYGLVTGSQFIETGRYKKVVIVGADMMSRIIDYTDRTTCIIFGDGCGAVLLEPTTEETGIQDFILHSDGNGATHLHMKAGGSLNPATVDTVNNKMHYVYQEGQAVFKHAVYNMSEVSAAIMERNKLEAKDINWLVPHQANKRIIEATSTRMGLGPEKVMMNIERYGNTTSGTIPLLLWDYEKQLKKGDNVIISAFGGGFTWGSIYLKWGYNSV